jgi:hypothetical protein
MTRMNKIYLLQRMFYYVTCYFTGMLNFQSALEDAKQAYREWKLNVNA